MRTLLALVICGGFLVGCNTTSSHTAEERCPHCNQYHGSHSASHNDGVTPTRVASPMTNLPLPPMVPAAE